MQGALPIISQPLTTSSYPKSNNPTSSRKPRIKTVSVPTKNYSAASPDKPWSKGNPTILSDEDVDAWLLKHAPSTARELRRESRVCLDAQSLEGRYQGSVTRGVSSKGQSFCFDAEDIPGSARPVSFLVESSRHWAFALYPGLGSLEICQITCSCLTEREATVLRMHFAEGLAGVQISKDLAIHPSNVFGILRTVRSKLYQAAKLNILPSVPARKHFTNVATMDEIDSIVREAPTAYYSPVQSYRANTKAYVCDCGHHLTLTNADLDHRKINPDLSSPKSKYIPERQFRCRFCKRTYPESVWHTILA